MANRIILNETSYFGWGSREVLVDEIKRRKFKKALLVTDETLLKVEAALKQMKNNVYITSTSSVVGKKEGEELEFGGLLGSGPIMPVNTCSPAKFINRGGRIPAPMQSLKN